MLQRKGLQVAQELGISPTVFSVYWMWRQAFLRHHLLSFWSKTHQGQLSPEDSTEMAAKLSTALQLCMQELGLMWFTAPIFFEHIPAKTIAAKGVQAV